MDAPEYRYTYRVARSPVFYGRSRISASVSHLLKGTRRGDQISPYMTSQIETLCKSRLHGVFWHDDVNMIWYLAA